MEAHQIIGAVAALLVGLVSLLTALLNIFKWFGELPVNHRFPVIGVLKDSSYRPPLKLDIAKTSSFRRAKKLCLSKPVLLVRCPLKIAPKIDFIVGDMRMEVPNYIYEKDKDALANIWQIRQEEE